MLFEAFSRVCEDDYNDDLDESVFVLLVKNFLLLDCKDKEVRKSFLYCFSFSIIFKRF